MTAQNQYVPVTRPTSGETPPADENRSQLTIPVRFGRRRTDQVGHLLFTPKSLLFHGTVEMRIAWTEVSGIDHAGADLVVSFHASQRTMRFACATDEEALRASVTGSHLAALAAADPYSAAGV